MAEPKPRRDALRRFLEGHPRPMVAPKLRAPEPEPPKLEDKK